jgi:uncharacterized lipoprotein YajG
LPKARHKVNAAQESLPPAVKPAHYSVDSRNGAVPEIHMTASRFLLVFIAPVLLLVGCSSTKTIRVAVPPRVDLRPYPVVGLVTFSSNRDADFERLATQKFIESVQTAQPGTRVIELGPEQQVLSSVGHKSWDVAALHAVKKASDVDVVIVGRLDMQKAKPKVQLSTMWKNLSAKADVTASLTARLFETQSGATMWTDSSKLTTTIAHGSLNSSGEGHLGMRDTEAAYGNMIDQLVFEVTDGFREHYVTRRVSRDDPQTASARD